MLLLGDCFPGSFYIDHINNIQTHDIVFLKHNSTVFSFMLAATTGGKDLGVVVSVEIRQRPRLPFFPPSLSSFLSGLLCLTIFL